MTKTAKVPWGSSVVVVGSGGVGLNAIQLATTIPNLLILEGIETWGGFHAEILKTPITWEDGYVIPPTAPGLGIELDETVALANPYDVRTSI